MSAKKTKALTLGDLAVWGKCKQPLTRALAGEEFKEIWMDSRKVHAGDVFVALTTEANDGHAFVSAAFKSGACAAIVAAQKLKTIAAVDRRRCIVVDDPLTAVGRMAIAYRKQLCNLTMVGITGSSGKTTTRAFIARVIRKQFKVGETFGNWNNHIGVPLSLLRFDQDVQVGLLELGANHENEIGPLARIVKPDIAVITNIGYAHIGNFGTLENTTKAKFEIAQGLNDKKSFLLLNGDDDRLCGYAKKQRLPASYFGFSPRCSVRAELYRVLEDQTCTFLVEGFRYTLPVPGRHFVYSALAAIAVGRHLGMDEETIAEALMEAMPVAMRGATRHHKGITYIIDCYNANPSSMVMAIELLRDLAGRKRPVAIIGDMLELGSNAKKLHQELGKQLATGGVKILIAVGEHAADIAAAARAAGMHNKDIGTAPNAVEAIAVARSMVKSNDIVLLKGSRGIKLETVLDGLTA